MWIKVVVLTVMLAPVSVEAGDVSLREYLENRIEEQDRRIRQEQMGSRVAIETALLAEIRRQDEERNARFALKEEVEAIRARVTDIERSKANTYIGIVVLALLGFVNLVKTFWNGK